MDKNETVQDPSDYYWTWKNDERDDFKNALGEYLKDVRKDSKITQKQLSAKTGISVSNIQQYESGKSEPSAFSLYKLFRSLKIQEVKDFFDNLNFCYSGAKPQSDSKEKADKEDEIKNLEIFEMVCKLNSLTPEGRQKAADFIQVLSTHPDYRIDEGEE